MMTPVQDADGCNVECSQCYKQAYHEFYGLCAECWMECSDGERAALSGQLPKEIIRTEIRVEPKEKEIITQRTITTRIPPAWEQAAVFLWRAAVTGALFYLGCKAEGWL
jgi:hypothetical protein